jgi:hypothetical protein
MIRRTFNLIASAAGFAVGTIYLFSDGTSVTANVIGASGSVAGFASLIGVVMIISAIGLFIVTAHHIDDREVNLEKLVRRTNTTQETAPTSEPIVRTSEINTHKVVHHKKK